VLIDDGNDMLQGEVFMMQPIFLDSLLVGGTMALIVVFVAYQIYLIKWLPVHGRQITAV
jgi:hypothetical protein